MKRRLEFQRRKDLRNSGKKLATSLLGVALCLAIMAAIAGLGAFVAFELIIVLVQATV